MTASRRGTQSRRRSLHADRASRAHRMWSFAPYIARDDKRVPLFSAFDWSTDATERILRVPAGFMRDRTQARIEARAQWSQQIDLARVEAGIELGLQTMAEMVASQGADAEALRREEPTADAARCPAIREKVSESREAPLNEVSPLNELNALRMLLSEQGQPREE